MSVVDERYVERHSALLGTICTTAPSGTIEVRACLHCGVLVWAVANHMRHAHPEWS